MINILHVVPCLENGGTEKYLINLLDGTYKEYNNIILSYSNHNYWESKLDKMNIKVINIDKPSKVGLLNNYKQLKDTIKENNIDIIYSYTFYNSSVVLLAAKRNDVKKRIVHAHTSQTEHKKNLFYYIYTFLSKIIISFLATDKLACSETAGKNIYFGRYHIVNNGIDIKKYSYDETKRKNLRKKYNIDENDLVIGNVGRLDKNKNQEFLIKIFEKYKILNKKSKLVLVGDGPEMQSLNKMVNNQNMHDDVLFLGMVHNANEIYNIFDYFVMTSHHEGLPFVVIEAMSNGLNIILSDSIDKSANINNKVKFISLNKSPSEWAQEINNMSCKRNNNMNSLKNNGFSLNDTINYIKRIYNR